MDSGNVRFVKVVVIRLKYNHFCFGFLPASFCCLGGRTGVDRELGKLGLTKAGGSLRGHRSKGERPGCSGCERKCKEGGGDDYRDEGGGVHNEESAQVYGLEVPVEIKDSGKQRLIEEVSWNSEGRGQRIGGMKSSIWRQ